MKKLYITGIAGMLGSNIAYLLKDRYEICGADKVKINAKDIKTEQMDLLDFDKLKTNIINFKPDYLIHTTAMVNVDLCEEEREAAYNLNTKLTEFITDICNEIKCKMVYISTDAVFDGVEDRLYTEKDLANPVNYYGMTKLLGERKVLEYGHTVVRTNIYGFNIQNKDSFGEWIYKSLQEDKSLNMFTDIDFSPILVNDLAEVLSIIIESEASGLYHICAEGCITKYDFGCALKKMFDIKVGEISRSVSENFNFKAVRSKHMGMSNKKFCSEFNITLSSPTESINKFYKLYCNGYQEGLRKWGKLDYADR